MGSLYVMHYLGQSNIGAGLGAGALYIGKGIVVGPRFKDMHVDPPARFAVLDRCPGVAVQHRPGV